MAHTYIYITVIVVISHETVENTIKLTRNFQLVKYLVYMYIYVIFIIFIIFICISIMDGVVAVRRKIIFLE